MAVEVRTEAYPHDWQGEVICSACGAEHQADHASVRLILEDDEAGRRVIADDLCDDCMANAAEELAVNVLRHEAQRNRESADLVMDEAEAFKVKAERHEKLAEARREYADELEAATEDPGGEWASLEDLKAATQAAKDYLETQPPPPPEGWRQRYDGEDIPF